MFENEEGYRSHFRDDWHRYNVKLKLRGKSPLTEAEFDNMDDGISSISGSDSEEEEKSNKPQVGSPKVVFESDLGQQMAVYKCLLYPKKVTFKKLIYSLSIQSLFIFYGLIYRNLRNVMKNFST